jgi:hypothetical protein
VVPFGNFEPDRGRFSPGSSPNVVNALPTATGWGPMPSLTEISTALAAECKGAIAVRTSAGAYLIFAFTAAKAYKLNTTDYTWTEVTRLAGGDYNLPEGDRWSFAVFGSYLIAVQLGDVPQYIDVDSGSNFDALAGSPPTARFVWVAGEHLVLGAISSLPNKVMVSGRGDAGYWTVGKRGCDYQEFPDGEEIMGGIGSEKGAIIFQRRMIRQMIVGAFGDYSFRTEVINPNRGVIAPYSIVQVGPGIAAYLSSDGFCMGVEGKPIGAERVDSTFFGFADNDTLASTRGVVDPYKKIIWWQVTLSSGNNLYGYNYQLDRWCHAESNVEEMVDLATPAITIDGLDLLYASIDDVTPSFDSRLFSGGLPAFAAFTTDHKLAYHTGANRAATFDTWEMQLNPGRRSFVQEVRPVLDATTYTMKIATAARHSGTALTFGSAVSPNSSTGICHFRSDGLLHKFRLEIAASQSWSHVMGLEDIRAKPTGRR